MEVDNADINSVCFGILCNFTPICGEDRAKEAVAIVRSLQAENKKLYKLIEEHQKLLHAYQDVVVPDYKNWIEQLEKERNDAVATLEESRLDETPKEVQQMRWIPVEEKLPEESVTVLAFNTDPHVEKYVLARYLTVNYLGCC